MNRRLLVACIPALVNTIPSYAQSETGGSLYVADQILVTDGTPLQMDVWLESRLPFQIKLIAPVKNENESDIAVSPVFKVMIGSTDVTSLFSFTQNS